MKYEEFNICEKCKDPKKTMVHFIQNETESEDKEEWLQCNNCGYHRVISPSPEKLKELKEEGDRLKKLHADRMKKYRKNNKSDTARKPIQVSKLVYETIKANADNLGVSIDKYLRGKLQK
jgi:DNA-directed RNA polymerase subunit RPC12/RpoP